MGRTIVEKIIGSHTGQDLTVGHGDTVEARVDTCLVDDTSAGQVIGELEKLYFSTQADSPKTYFCIESASPASDAQTAVRYKFIRQFAIKSKCVLSDVGSGTCEFMADEQAANPGDILIQSGSGQSTGALGALTMVPGAAEIASAIAFGKCRIKMPPTIKIFITGEFPYGVSVFDLMLHIASLTGADAAIGKVLEFCGPAVDSMSMGSRFALCSMTSMTGALGGLIASDEITRAFLAKMGRAASWRPIEADFDASYERVFEFSVDKLTPMVLYTGDRAKIHPIAETEGLTLDQAYFGADAGYGLEDWEILCRIVRGKKKAPGVRFIVSPGSKLMEKRALDAGYFQVLADFGALILAPGYSACKYGGAMAEGECCLTSYYRDYHDESGVEVYQASPATIAASAVEGVIADPRKYEKELKSKAFPAIVRTEALKKIAAAAMESLEFTASEAAKRYKPRLQETSDTVEKKAREVIKKYGPQARRATDELEKTIKNLAQDAKSTFKDLISRRKAGKTSEKTAPEPGPERAETLKKVARKTPAEMTAPKKTVRKKTVGKTADKTTSRKVSKKKAVKKVAVKKAPAKKVVKRKTRSTKSSSRGN